jgi:putative transposase
VARIARIVVPGLPHHVTQRDNRGEAELARLHAAETVGRPIGSAAFLKRLSRKLGRSVEPGRRGRKPKGTAERRE